MRAALCCFALLTPLLVAGCETTMRDVSLARAGVARFHQEMDAGQFNQIYSEAAPEFRTATPYNDFFVFMGATQGKLGKVQDPTETGFNVNWTPSATQVVLSYQTKFAMAAATETFTWKIAGGRLALVGYHIESSGLGTQ
jgi:hypothetical protein